MGLQAVSQPSVNQRDLFYSEMEQNRAECAVNFSEVFNHFRSIFEFGGEPVSISKVMFGCADHLSDQCMVIAFDICK